MIVEGLQMIRPGLPVKTEPAVLDPSRARDETDGPQVDDRPDAEHRAEPPKS